MRDLRRLKKVDFDFGDRKGVVGVAAGQICILIFGISL